MTPRMSDATVNPAAFRLDHVAIAVRDLDAALGFYRDVLGMPVGGVERVAEQEVDVAFVGEEPGRIELIAPIKPDTGVARFIDKRGEGLHHIAVRVGNIAAAVEALKAKGVPLIDTEPRAGAHGTRVAFVHPKGAGGVLLELVELSADAHD
jgi:methylmalonyl-CoA/ethylmalonyl-CoA epimerase